MYCDLNAAFIAVSLSEPGPVLGVLIGADGTADAVAAAVATDTAAAKPLEMIAYGLDCKN